MHLEAGNKDFGGDKYILSFSHFYRNKSQENILLWRSQDVNQTSSGLVDFCWNHKYSYLYSYLDFCSLGELPPSSASTERDYTSQS